MASSFISKRRTLNLESLETRKLMAGDLDLGFNLGNGYAVSDVGFLNNEQVLDMAIQSNGQIVVAGSTDFGTGDANFMLGRYDSDGQLDLSFGGTNGAPDGFVVTDFGGHEWAQKVLILDDGDILAGGQIITAEGNTRIYLMRYNSDGTAEESFGIDGLVEIEWPGIHYGFDMGVDSGKILLRFDNIIMRLNEEQGLLDNTFLGGGAINTELQFQFDASGMSIFNDEVYVSGQDMVSAEFTVLKMDMNAVIDVGYGTMGLANVDQEIQSVFDFAMDGSGRLLGTNSGHLFRLTADGEMDVSLNVDGLVELNDMNGTEVIAQPGGLISVVGYTPGGDADVSIRRFGNDGTVDNSFGVGGKAVHDFNSAHYVYATGAFSYANKNIFIAGNIRELEVASNDILLTRIDGKNEIVFDLPNDLKQPGSDPGGRPLSEITGLVFGDGEGREFETVIAPQTGRSDSQRLVTDQYFAVLEDDDGDVEEDMLQGLLPILGR